ncbi:hypothetical protein [Pseudomonas khavaziana]|uniref:hypothetical protein n=1 Tax=Pseudomonas khavaziana TaxID=2842351 RepID=UPI001C3D7821|nr:hypothetical protein [Pseudomonas khavaziana]MBV4478735.1 hypothetical protein [Pseudomonas khavaziana]
MTQTMQEQFEQAFSDDNGKMPVAFIKLQRQGDSYSVPRVARAWYWFKRSRETLVVDLPAVEAWDNDGRLDREKDDTANCAMGLAPVIDVRIAMTAAGISIKATA